jgi:hypothetical protein
MTAHPVDPPVATQRATPAPVAWTAAGAVVALGCTLVGQYVETPWKASGEGTWGVDFDGNGGWGALAVLVAVIAAAAVIVGAVATRARALPPERAAGRSLVLAALGAVSVLVFWAGLPAVLAGGAIGLALDSRHRAGRFPVTAAAASALAVLTVTAAVWLAVTG